MTAPTRTRKPSPPRGSTLLMVTILLAVLAVVGVASVSLSSQERINASAKGRRDMMAACANAARLVIWAEVAKYGSGRLREPRTEARVTLSDGTVLSAPAHFKDDDALQVIELRNYPAPLGDSGAGTNMRSGTNSIIGFDGGGPGGGTAYAFSARCRDAKGRQAEVEFTTAFVF